jgi:hypothetical protein
MNRLTHTCKAVASVLPNEYRTLNSLLEYIGNDVCETLQLVRDQLDIIDKRTDIVHSRYKINEVLISFDLPLDGLSRFMSNVPGSERTMVPCIAKQSPAMQNWHTGEPELTWSVTAS